ncbi:MAG: ImmA/IrrE family metallo-endopeptidase [Sphaerochaeta sp.]|uniref:ImmA/IrrE family metallo-endopeptidase n=1 Tax=Sphaerochaeta sp. TaxID=1972642 RepID=UPI003D1140A5
MFVCPHLVTGDRQRFTLAHELGHFYLSGKLDASMDEKKSCLRFAQAFLLPSELYSRN